MSRETAKLGNRGLGKPSGYNWRRRWLWLVLIVVALAGPTVLAQSGGPFDLSWNSIAGGGGTSTGGTFALSGAIGQADAGAMTGGTFTLNGGFVQSAAPALVETSTPSPATPTMTRTPTVTATPTVTRTPTITPTPYPEGPNKLYLPLIRK